MSTNWNTYQAKQLTKAFRQYCQQHDATCWLCQQPINYNAGAHTKYGFQADHYWPRHHRPDLAYEWDNLRPAHATCNASRRHKLPPRPQPPNSPASRRW